MRLAALLSLLGAAACGHPGGAPVQLDRAGTPIRALLSAGEPRRGEGVYERRCRRCHGDAGDGLGPMADALPRPPRSFARGDGVRDVAPERLYQIVREGGASVGLSRTMPAFGPDLNDRAIADVLAYVRSLGSPDRRRR